MQNNWNCQHCPLNCDKAKNSNTKGSEVDRFQIKRIINLSFKIQRSMVQIRSFYSSKSNHYRCSLPFQQMLPSAQADISRRQRCRWIYHRMFPSFLAQKPTIKHTAILHTSSLHSVVCDKMSLDSQLCIAWRLVSNSTVRDRYLDLAYRIPAEYIAWRGENLLLPSLP